VRKALNNSLFQSKRLHLAADNSASIPLPDVQAAVDGVIMNAVWTTQSTVGRQWKRVSWKRLAIDHQNSVVVPVRHERSTCTCLIHCNSAWLVHVSCITAITLDKLTIRVDDWELVFSTVMDDGVMVIIWQLRSMHWIWDARWPTKVINKADLTDQVSVGWVFVQCVDIGQSDKKVVWTCHRQALWIATSRPRRQRVVLANCSFVYATYVIARKVKAVVSSTSNHTAWLWWRWTKQLRAPTSLLYTATTLECICLTYAFLANKMKILLTLEGCWAVYRYLLNIPITDVQSIVKHRNSRNCSVWSFDRVNDLTSHLEVLYKQRW